MRRVGAALAVLVLVLTFAPAAVGQLAVTRVEFLFGPAEGGAVDRSWSPPPGTVVDGTWQVRVRATSTGSLSRLVLHVESEDGLPVSGEGPPPREYTLIPATREDELSFAWGTAALTPLNGRYRWVAEAASHLGSIATAVLPDLQVNNPPEPPSSVTARLDGATPVVTWGPAKEGDVTGWRVWRAAADTESVALVGEVASPQYRDEAAPAGAHAYQVNAIRRSPVSPRGIASQLSEKTTDVVVPGVVPTPPAPSPAPKQAQPRGRPQGVGTFDAQLPYANPAAGPSPPGPTPKPSPSPLAASSTPARFSAGERLRFGATGVLLLGAALLLWRLRGRLLTCRPK
jgi:hypothetical protein